MVRTTHTLTIASLLLLSACPSTDNNVGTVLTDGGGAGGAAHTGGTTTAQGGAVGSGGAGSGGTIQPSQTGGTTSAPQKTDGGTQDAPQDSAGQVAQHPYVSNGASCINYPNLGYRSFPLDPSIQTGQGGQSWPTCTLNCNVIMATAGTIQEPLDQALPDGPCDDEGASCNSPLMAGWCGPCANTGGPGNGYTCTCRAQKWQCALASQGMNVCDPPRCLDPSLDVGFPPPQSCSQITWSATQVCGCGKCQDLCSSDSECQSGHCNLNQVCQFPDSCKGSADCRAPCTGLCEPAASDGGQRSETGNVAPTGNNLGAPCDLGFAAGPGQAAWNSTATECLSSLCFKPSVQSGAGNVDTGAYCTASCSTDDDCSRGQTRDPRNPNDKSCISGYTCGMPFVKGSLCCQKLCVCRDFTGGAIIPTPMACENNPPPACN